MNYLIADTGTTAAEYQSASAQLALIGRIREGFSVKAVQQSAEAVGLALSDLSDFGVVAPRTLSHARRAGRLSSTQSDRIAQFFNLYTIAMNTFGSSERARNWLSRPSAALENRTPVSLLDTQTGAQLVEDLLRRIDHGLAA